jgi:hypothetical protein
MIMKLKNKNKTITRTIDNIILRMGLFVSIAVGFHFDQLSIRNMFEKDEW